MSRNLNILDSTAASEGSKDTTKSREYSRIDVGMAIGGIALGLVGGITAGTARAVSVEQATSAREVATDVYEMPEVQDTFIGDMLEDTLAESGEGYLADNLTTTSIVAQEHGASVLLGETSMIDVTQQLNEARDLASSSETLDNVANVASFAAKTGGVAAGLGLAGVIDSASKKRRKR